VHSRDVIRTDDTPVKVLNPKLNQSFMGQCDSTGIGPLAVLKPVARRFSQRRGKTVRNSSLSSAGEIVFAG
jgi:hypothetical protein